MIDFHRDGRWRTRLLSAFDRTENEPSKAMFYDLHFRILRILRQGQRRGGRCRRAGRTPYGLGSLFCGQRRCGTLALVEFASHGGREVFGPFGNSDFKSNTQQNEEGREVLGYGKSKERAIDETRAT